MTLESQQKLTSLSFEKWWSVTARIKESEIPLLMNRLKECGCGNVNQLLKEFLTRRIDKVTEDQQLMRMIQTNESGTGLKSILSGNYRYEFYKDIDEEDFERWLIDQRNIEKGYAHDMRSYFHRFKDQFFGSRPEELRKGTEKIRS
jgi:hypothetical protein